MLDEAGFDAFVEKQCAKFYADGLGRPSLAPGRYFRMLLVGYFEGLDSERGIAWRAADSLSLRESWTLRSMRPRRTTRRLFTWVLQRLPDAGLVKGKTIGIDATTLEANAALRSIVRRDTGEGYETFLRGLAAASGISTPTGGVGPLGPKAAEEGSNDDWTHPQDPDYGDVAPFTPRNGLVGARKAVDGALAAAYGGLVDTSDDEVSPRAAAAQRRRTVSELQCGAVRGRLGWSSGFPR